MTGLISGTLVEIKMHQFAQENAYHENRKQEERGEKRTL
jgi:hypothetical protein